MTVDTTVEGVTGAEGASFPAAPAGCFGLFICANVQKKTHIVYATIRDEPPWIVGCTMCVFRGLTSAHFIFFLLLLLETPGPTLLIN